MSKKRKTRKQKLAKKRAKLPRSNKFLNPQGKKQRTVDPLMAKFLAGLMGAQVASMAERDAIAKAQELADDPEVQATLDAEKFARLKEIASRNGGQEEE